ncbi:ATP-binding protein [Leptolyngbya sp. PL-A3]|uniref:hybrid sensor histidine kinase/response regulator n=1 Tax=Leptolyngbya sp. PL-A3 TaxID=2933911 RepID=UPI0032987663
MVLIAGSLLPVALFAVVIVQKLSIEEQEATERRTVLAARTLAETVEQETSSTVRTLQALAESERLEQDDLKGFHTEIRRVLKTQPTWMTIVLVAPNGQQLVNARQPFGKPLPSINERGSFWRVVQTRKPAIGDLAVGTLTQTMAFPIRVPVLRDGELRYVLTAVITPQALTSTVETQAPIDGEWTRTIVDSAGIVVARTRSPERFVGQRGTPLFLEQIASSTEGIYQNTSLEGERVYMAFHRLSDSRWTAAVIVPIDVVHGPARQAMGLVVGSGVVLLLFSIGGALALSDRISRSIASATAGAEALAQGEDPKVGFSAILEVALLGKALERSAQLLTQREQERAEHLARAEAARAEAETANRLKDEFLITISHELKTPLNAILGWSTLLRTGRLEGEKMEQAIATIERNAKVQAHLVDDLLDTSRIITGKLRLETQPLDFSSVVASAMDSIRHAAEAKDIELYLHRLSTIEPIMGDQNRLQQVVWNLLSNAVKFTPRGGQVTAEVQSIDSFTEVVIRDTGRGIKPEFLPHVFDRFRQADSSTTREFGGLGLGLAIVRHLVEMHGGTVEADSPGSGQGAIFTLRFPITTISPSIRRRSPQALTTQNPNLSVLEANKLPDVRVVVVDDERDAREFIAAVLMQQGAEVKSCSSAAEAFETITAWKPAVILSDIGMPQEDGYVFMSRVRAWEAGVGGTIPAIALTAFTRKEDRERAIAAGYQLHIPKPVDPIELVTAIVELIKQ